MFICVTMLSITYSHTEGNDLAQTYSVTLNKIYIWLLKVVLSISVNTQKLIYLQHTELNSDKYDTLYFEFYNTKDITSKQVFF